MSSPAEIRSCLLRHYDAHARALPWRNVRDPYRVWISEIMLQQTRVAAVEQRYERFLRRFPNLTALAASRAEQVCEEWAGLGYYARARRLREAARRVMRALERAGFALVRQRGSHRVYRNAAGRQLTFAYHDTVRLGTPALRRIARDAGITLENLLTLS